MVIFTSNSKLLEYIIVSIEVIFEHHTLFVARAKDTNRE